MPASVARRASRPVRLPIHSQAMPRARSAAATASPGEVWPPVPPPAMMIIGIWRRSAFAGLRRSTVGRSSRAVSQGSGARRSGDHRARSRRAPALDGRAITARGPLARSRSTGVPRIPVAFEGERDQALDQLAVGETRGLPEARIGAGRGEAGDRVDLVQDDAVA